VERPVNLGVRWTLHGDGRTPAPGAVVRPDERLSWPRTAGLGAQHVVAMFGASFVAPVLMGLDPNLAIMMSGVATVIFLLATRGKVPSYLGCSLSFVGVAATIRASGGDSATVTGAVLVVGAALFVAGLAVQRFGARIIHSAMPPIVTGAVVMLIGFNLAPVTASTYWPQDQWTALLVMLFTGLAVVCLRGFFSRIAIFLGLIFGYVLSWALDRVFGKIHSPVGGAEAVDHWRLDLSGVAKADWIGLPSFHAPSFEWSAILVALPVVIALIAENAGHVKAVGEMTGEPLDDKLGTAIAADGAASMLSTAVGGPPNTTYSENIGVMAATRVYSTAAYWAAAGFALLFGLCPKFGAVVAAIPGGVLGGITVILYGMIGLLGAQIWINAKVDLRNPLNLVPAAAGIIIGVGGVSLKITDNFELSGIALGTIVVITGYHVLRAFAPAHMKERMKDEEPLLDSGIPAGAGGLGSGPDERPVVTAETSLFPGKPRPVTARTGPGLGPCPHGADGTVRDAGGPRSFPGRVRGGADAVAAFRPAPGRRARGVQPGVPGGHGGVRPVRRGRALLRPAGRRHARRALRPPLSGGRGRSGRRPAAARVLAAVVPVPPPSRRAAAAVRACRHQRPHRARPGPRRRGHLPCTRP
jgi:uracil-xanthine permease